ncbi:MAG: hypothetical protein KTR14_09945 [Vampirovibrio sp.]|nr:hypothetical protein [Vampirovibrio sp.]
MNQLGLNKESSIHNAVSGISLVEYGLVGGVVVVVGIVGVTALGGGIDGLLRGSGNTQISTVNLLAANPGAPAAPAPPVVNPPAPPPANGGGNNGGGAANNPPPPPAPPQSVHPLLPTYINQDVTVNFDPNTGQFQFAGINNNSGGANTTSAPGVTKLAALLIQTMAETGEMPDGTPIPSELSPFLDSMGGFGLNIGDLEQQANDAYYDPATGQITNRADSAALIDPALNDFQQQFDAFSYEIAVNHPHLIGTLYEEVQGYAGVITGIVGANYAAQAGSGVASGSGSNITLPLAPIINNINAGNIQTAAGGGTTP